MRCPSKPRRRSPCLPPRPAPYFSRNRGLRWWRRPRSGGGRRPRWRPRLRGTIAPLLAIHLEVAVRTGVVLAVVAARKILQGDPVAPAACDDAGEVLAPAQVAVLAAGVVAPARSAVGIARAR